MMDLEKIAEEIRTQDNRATADPIFILFDRQKMPTDRDFSDEYIYMDVDNDNNEIDGNFKALLEYVKDERRNIINFPERLDDLNEDGLFELMESDRKFEKVYVKTIDVFKQAFFTDKSAHEYLDANKHNLKDPHIYCDSLYRNYEMQAIRNALIAGAFKPRTKNEIAVEIFGMPFDKLPMKDCQIVNTHYNDQVGVKNG
jgi:hypothetical protein